jgi:hypothetical protein
LTEYVLPISEQESVATVLQAMQQAEAAQQQLMTTGPLAEAAAGGNGVIADTLATHKKMQQLYHQSARLHLETYRQLAISPAGEQLCFTKPEVLQQLAIH